MAAKISRERVGEMLQITLLELKNMGGEVRVKELMERVEPKLKLSGNHPKYSMPSTA